jgi:hypothetical protein
MRRAYIATHVDLPESYRLARNWAGGDSTITIIGPSTSVIKASPWLEKTGLPIGTTSNRHSQYIAQARAGTVIAWCLHLDEILDLESDSELNGLVVVHGHNNHAPWITAHDVEFLGGEPVPRVPEATAAVKAMVHGISLLPVLNQGLIDSRERSMAVQALTYMRHHGHELVPNQLVVEGIRNSWPGTSPLAMADIAKQLNAGKRLHSEKRINPDALANWAAT